MNLKIHVLLLAAAVLCMDAAQAQRKRSSDRLVPSGLESRVKKFFSDKEAQARQLAEQENQTQVPEIWEFFEAGRNGDWGAVAAHYRTLRRGAYQFEGGRKDPRLETVVWQPVNESFGAYDECASMAEEYVEMFGQEILEVTPRGSIYFGGTDPGRWLVTLFAKSHPEADPCFVLTQNALADGLYLKYIRMMYGDRLATPTDDDSKKAFQEYLADAEQRLKEGKLKPGENVSNAKGKVQVSGQVAVMQVNARIARAIFDANPAREFFIEESFPLDWMYPHLSPRGLIMKLERKPLPELPAGVVLKDHEYWTQFIDRTLGKWLTPDTSVEAVCKFARTVFEDKDLNQFKGDRAFVTNASACKTYSKLRSSIGGVYAWRARNSSSTEEKQRLAKEADFAFRQSFALCPYSPEAVARYSNLLVDQGRKKEALQLAETAERIDPQNPALGNLVGELEERK